MKKEFSPENETPVIWKKIPSTMDGSLDFRELTGVYAPTVSYVCGDILADTAEWGLFAVTVDYYAKIWQNGELIADIEELHGSSSHPVIIPIQLKKGKNSILIKVGSGRAGHNLRLQLIHIES